MNKFNTYMPTMPTAPGAGAAGYAPDYDGSIGLSVMTNSKVS